ncbi:hypothetical protein CARUB_v10021176mg [Capsella rubella]|uniref:Uncharacterized protein n=1 Tax=Capsella rubella TaxID=81985 RepID=R0IGH4_9BRAS|nr:hypothetical protein CARUB_v10021176mg [Capsella rubella]
MFLEVQKVNVSEELPDESSDAFLDGYVMENVLQRRSMPMAVSERVSAEKNLLVKRLANMLKLYLMKLELTEDFLNYSVKELLPRCPDLRLILMSATLNAELFSNELHRNPDLV